MVYVKVLERKQRETMALPENLEWPDRGCWAAPKCLTCPLAVCIEDLPTGDPAARPPGAPRSHRWKAEAVPA